MDGVTILNTVHEYVGLISPMWAEIFLIGFIMMAVITVAVDNPWCLIPTLILFVATMVCWICTLIPTDKVISKSYDVIISDDVDFNEFYEKYEVVEQNGKIYTIKERE